MKFLHLVLCAVFMAAMLLLESGAVNPVIGAALIGAGAQLLGGGGGGGSGGQIYSFKGQNINANDCWEDGSGPCPNGKIYLSVSLSWNLYVVLNHFRQLFGQQGPQGYCH